MKRIVLALLMIGVLGSNLAPEANAYVRRPLLRRGLAAVARVGVGVGYGLSRAYGYRGYGYPGYYGGYRGYGYGGFGIGFY